jgi:hypothetical protein
MKDINMISYMHGKQMYSLNRLDEISIAKLRFKAKSNENI